MIITKGFGSEYLITEGYGSSLIVIISPVLYLFGEFKIGKRFKQLVFTPDKLYLDLHQKLLFGFDGKLYFYLNENVAVEL